MHLIETELGVDNVVREKKLVGYLNVLDGTFKSVKEIEAEKSVEQQKSFDQYANVFNTPAQAATFIAQHRPGYVVVKVGRKYVPATPEFAKRMGLKVIRSKS